MSDEDLIYLNGINGITGEYLVAPMPVSAAAQMARGEVGDKNTLNWLASIWHKIRTPFLGLPLGVDPAEISQAGWGIVFAKDETPAVKAAFQTLIEHRRKQIGNDALVKVLDYRPGEGWEDWLGRYGVSPGNVQPTRLPYYLLLVGSPVQIPFEFGQLLDVDYGVGRLYFEQADQYAAYAAAVIEYETAESVENKKEAVFFATRHPFDQATKISADLLAGPLADGSPAHDQEPAAPGVAGQWGFQSQKLIGQAASKAALLQTISAPAGGKPPAFLFTASHGMGFPRGDPAQPKAQGALLCQDWPGFGTIAPEHYFSAADVPPNACVRGMVIFHFACYGAGTPSQDQFIHTPGQPPPGIAEAPFFAALPQTWLAHPAGGALACIGHVERAWGYSIVSPSAGPQIQTFQNAIGRILTGQPLGYALKDFNERYAALSTSLSAILQQAGWGADVDQNTLATTWIERNDAEGYVLFGDPAVKLRAAELSKENI